jgi:hypothetical protein
MCLNQMARLTLQMLIQHLWSVSGAVAAAPGSLAQPAQQRPVAVAVVVGMQQALLTCLIATLKV